MGPSLLYTSDIVPTIFERMFENMGKPAKLLLFEKSPLQEKTGSNIMNKVQFACDDDDKCISTVLLALQCMSTNHVGVNLTTKLVVSLLVVVQVFILVHLWLHVSSKFSMDSSYIRCNFTRVTHFSHRKFLSNLTVVVQRFTDPPNRLGPTNSKPNRSTRNPWLVEFESIS